MRIRLFVAIALSAILLAGCQSNSSRDTGTIIGGIAGGVLGNQVGAGSGRTIAIIAGTLFGAYLGGEMGQQMDENDRYRTQRTLEGTPVNQTSAWHNPDTGNSYEVTPTRTFQSSTGPCREYTADAVIDGRAETVYGTACRQPDGSWQAAN
ncbi:MAG: RT0821/Lpp0805 family surface protein [Sedimenticola sp.]